MGDFENDELQKCSFFRTFEPEYLRIMYKIESADKQTWNWEHSDEGMSLNGLLQNADIQHIDGRFFHLLLAGKSFNLEVLNHDISTKSISIKVNGNVYEMALKDDLDLLLEKLGFDSRAAAKVNEIKSPMPGLVLKVLVEAGQELKAGDPVLVLESMKMENIIKSPGDAVVASVVCEVGKTVEKGAVLVKFA